MTAAPGPVRPLAMTFAGFMNLGPDKALIAADWATELGYSSFWTAEINSSEAFSTLAAVGSRAPTLGLGTGVLALQLRTPPLTAMAAATLQALHPDQEILLGVGISSPVVVGSWHGAEYGDRPIAQMREYVALLRECFSGESVTFEGDFYQVRRFRLGVRLGEQKPKIIVAALNPRMLHLAGEVADGVLLNYLPSTLVPWAVGQVREGSAGRADEPTVYAYVHCSACEREDGIDHARRDLFSYAVVDAYARNFERGGFADEVAEIRERHVAKDREGAVAAVSDRMVDAINIMGTPDHIGRAVRAYRDAGVDVPVVMPLPWGPDRMATVRATLEAAAST